MKPKNYKDIVSISLAILMVSITAIPANSQYYFKDLVTVQQINETFRLYKINKVKKVTLNSFQADIPVTEGFICEQLVNLPKNEVSTYTKTLDRGESFFTAYYQQQGLLIKTIDSTEQAVSYSVYQYDALKRLTLVQSTTRAIDNSSSESEAHYWQYSASGGPQKMMRVKNNIDTIIVSFTADEKGNIIEEDINGKADRNQKFYYYYDEKNRLTDIVRYNQKVKRLLPDYIFEYEENGDLSTATIVPEGSSEYQKFYYQYDENSLKIIEFCYNKKNVLLGKVEYKYTLGK